MEDKSIIVKGARVNNLKNIDIEIPLNEFVVMTGVSGSGKSSLAFDTLYAEGQRRYVESLSSYARQFLGRMSKPECDYIKALPPAIAIEQKVNTRNPRSTVGTSTEIYDYLRMLFARIGKTYSPISGEVVKRQTIDDIVAAVNAYPEGTRLAVLIDVHLPEGRSLKQQLDIYMKEGYSRMEHDGGFIMIEDLLQREDTDIPSDCRLLIDRMSVSSDKDELSRLTDSVETAYFEGHDECVIMLWTDEGVKTLRFSKKFAADGMEFRVPDDLMFNFNNPYGACPTCEGFGNVLGVSEDLVIPDKTKSIYQSAVKCWSGDKMSLWKKRLIRLAPHYNFPVHTPYMELTEEQKDFLWKGAGEWEGIDGFFRMLDANSMKIQYRVMKARYRGKTVCPDCHGTRLRKDVRYVKINGKSIVDLNAMPITQLAEFFDSLQLSESEEAIARRLLLEIRSRLHFLKEVGLGYLTLNRGASTLSGGESQRINLATSLGSALVGSLYILDEPSIGLHPRDTDRLISVLKKLRDTGNTVIVVEHDEEIMRAADRIVDIGRGAGVNGGNVVFNGPLEELLKPGAAPESYTADYLQHRLTIHTPKLRRPWKSAVTVKGAMQNNLKNIDVKFPLGVLTAVTGVSGSGKSTLVKDILFKSLQREFLLSGDEPGINKGVKISPAGAVKDIQFVDQNPIGTSTRSNPATYLKAYDELRKLFAKCQLSAQMGYTPAYFSFNADGGRCEECLGEGKITIPMQFMADISVECPVCHGMRFKKEILDVKYHGKNIYDMLEMSVTEAIEFLKEHPSTFADNAVEKLMPLQEVGLGYIKLGQSSSTLSGGESQRVKLAYFISQANNSQPTLFIFDEPTTGLHFHDIDILLKSFERLIECGHSIIIVEHNIDMIKAADWVIDLGPEGGEEGGWLVAEGTPEQIAACERSYTGRYLRKALENKND